jgi:hypothetical protein
MDWDYAIERSRVPLLGHVIALFAMIGLSEGVTIERLSKPLYREVLQILRAAESAVRRLIVAAARDIVVEPRKRRPAKPRQKPTAKHKTDGEAKPKRKRGFLFNLFDPLRRSKNFSGRRPKRPRSEPRITVIDYDPRIPEFLRAQFMAPAPVPAAPVVEEKVDDGTVNARPLIRRLLAITDALRDIPRQAMRLARWQARPKEERRPERWSPLRVGRPPGFRKRPKHEVDEILKECHWLARNAHPTLDTS